MKKKLNGHFIGCGAVTEAGGPGLTKYLRFSGQRAENGEKASVTMHESNHCTKMVGRRCKTKILPMEMECYLYCNAAPSHEAYTMVALQAGTVYVENQ